MPCCGSHSVKVGDWEIETGVILYIYVLVRGQVLGSGTARQKSTAKEKAAQHACQALGISA